ncbi:MAG: RNA-binding S4 domain-containing protein [Chitinophagales bacterium]
MREVPIHTPYITLDQFLKWSGLAETGGEAKLLIAEGKVKVGGVPETRRGRKLHPGDEVEFGGERFVVTASRE